MTCGKASRKKPEMRTVTSMRGRPSSASGIGVETDDPARHLVPARAHAEERQHLGDVVARRAHRRRAPHRETDRPRPLAGVGAVPGEQVVGEALPGLPGESGRDRLRVDGVEVAAGRQHVDETTQGRPRRTGRDVAAVERVEHRVDLARRAPAAAGRPRGTRRPANGIRHRCRPAGRRPAGRARSPAPPLRPSRPRRARRRARSPAPRRRRRTSARSAPHSARAPSATPARRRRHRRRPGWPAGSRARGWRGPPPRGPRQGRGGRR